MSYKSGIQARHDTNAVAVVQRNMGESGPRRRQSAEREVSVRKDVILSCGRGQMMSGQCPPPSSAMLTKS